MRSSYWRELYAARRDWAIAAHEAFLADVDKSLKFDRHQEKHATAVLYGSTQVGKTTLILNLLGVAPEQVEPIADVLRGEPGKGRSATATALRYRRSPDDFWHVGSMSAKGLNNEAAREYFRALRKQVEDGTWLRTSEACDLIDVFLPSTCFSQTFIRDIDIRLVDLPGLNAVNENERVLVHKLARQHVPYADLVILVGLGDSLGFIEPGALELPELEHWWAEPYRFRIVCTRGFDSDSTANWLRGQNSIKTVGAVREKLIEQFSTHDSRFPSDMKQRLYVVEIGQSWRVMEQEDPNLFALTAPLVNEFMRELIESIREAANPWFRLKSAWELPHTAKRKCRTVTAEQVRHLRQMRPLLTDARDRYRKVEAFAMECEKRIYAYCADMIDVEDFLRMRASAIPEEMFAVNTAPLVPCARTRQEVLDHAKKYIEILDEQWDSIVDKLGDWPEAIALPSLGTRPELVSFKTLFDKLERYWTDRYLLDSSWKDDIDLLDKAYETTRTEYAQRVGYVIRTSLVVARDELSRKLRLEERRRRLLLRLEDARKTALVHRENEWKDAT